MTFDYSNRADVLYVTLKDTEAACTYVEIGNGIVCRVDEHDGAVVGVTIRDFMRHVRNGDELSIPGLDEGLPISKMLSVFGQV